MTQFNIDQGSGELDLADSAPPAANAISRIGALSYHRPMLTR